MRSNMETILLVHGESFVKSPDDFLIFLYISYRDISKGAVPNPNLARLEDHAECPGKRVEGSPRANQWIMEIHQRYPGR